MNNYLGHYSVGTQLFTDKIQAILEANKTLANIEWHFNKEVFSATDWTSEPATSLDEFYRIRAQQIRERFDYVVVMCSGGADSTNAVWAFLNNGIAIDEVVASAPMSGIKNVQFNERDTRASNQISETIYAQIPLLQEISTKHPNIKVTLHDYFEDMLGYQTDEWLYSSADWIHPTTVARYSLEKYKHLKDMAEAGKRIAIVYGIDKPSVISDGTNLYMAFYDITVNVQRPAFKIPYSNVENVLFYFTPELPLMLVKECHTIAKWFFRPEHAHLLKYMMKTDQTLSFPRRRLQQSRYERSIVPAIYPSLEKKVFQGEKATRMFLADHDNWFYQLHNGTMTYQMIDSDFRNFIKHINPKYLNVARLGFKAFDQTYNLGPIANFRPLIQTV